MRRSSYLSACIGALFLSLLPFMALFVVVVDAKEIEPKADAWTVIGENDTIPAGMHVRIDMTTGEKWVKQMTEEERSGGGGGRSSSDGGGSSVALQVSGDTVDDDTTSQTTRPSKQAYDYDRMYETLAQLPLEEFEPMGGLPEPVKPTTATPEQRQFFEARMKEIWEKRQELLQQIQREQLIDLPEVLKTHIGFLRDYYNGKGEHSITQIKDHLLELEFLVTDVDMARDFYTLQGWPWLLAMLLHDQSNETATAEVEGLQAAAAWVVGTAVQNTGEFVPYVVEPILLPNGTIISALDGLVHVWNDQIMNDDMESTTSTLPQKVLYALSACLRGNLLAQHVFDQKKQPERLRQHLQDTPTDTAHGRKQILRLLQLGSDLLMEWGHTVEGAVNGESTVATVDGFRQAWVTPDWCHVVLDKTRCLSQADKRLPILDAWYPHCQSMWNPARVQELLVMENATEEDADTRALQKKISQKLVDSTQL